MSDCNNGAACCGRCAHWHRKPKSALGLGQIDRGDCRQGPPHATSLPVVDQRTGQQAGVNVVSSYPDLPANFPACGQFKTRLAGVEA